MHKKENINNALLKALKSGDLDKVERIVISNQNLVNKLFYVHIYLYIYIYIIIILDESDLFAYSCKERTYENG